MTSRRALTRRPRCWFAVALIGLSACGYDWSLGRSGDDGGPADGGSRADASGEAGACARVLEIQLASAAAAGPCLPLQVLSDRPLRAELDAPSGVSFFSDTSCTEPITAVDTPTRLYVRYGLPEGRRSQRVELRAHSGACVGRAEVSVRMPATQLLPGPCALLENGERHCWGGDRLQPARDDVLGRDVPAGSMALGAGWCSLLAGRVWCEPVPSSVICDPLLGARTPVTPPGLERGVERLVAQPGGATCAVKGGDARCFGASLDRIMGPGWSACDAQPSLLPLSDVRVVGVGPSVLCASDGQGLSCWGDTRFGALGAGPPEAGAGTRIERLGAAVTAIQCAKTGCCARVDEGLSCWGDEARFLPERQPGVADAPRAVVGLEQATGPFALSDSGGCAVARNELWCWGDNLGGLAGTRDAAPRVRLPSPVSLPAGTLHDVLLAGGEGERATFTLIEGVVYAFGLNRDGRLGVDPQLADAYVPTPAGFRMSEEAALVLAPQVGMPHCLVGEDGLTCWGLLTLGLSGFDEQSIEGRYVTEPQALELLPGHVEQLVAAEGYLLAVAEGQAYSWGTESAADLLGRGAPPSPEVPGLIALPGRVTALAAAQDHGCALVDAPAAPVQCWGVGLSGQLGVGDAGDADRVRSPQPVGGLAGRSVAAIEVARGSSCAIVDGGVMCWGEIAGASGSPVAVQGLEPGRLEAVHSLALADGQGCAVDAAGNLACWGAQAVPRARLVRPGMARVRASRDNLCATDREGALFCWGANRRGSLGLGDAAPRSEPTRVSGVSVVDDAFALVGGSQAATCARTSADGDVLCWGANDARQRAVGPWIVRTPLPTLPWEP